MKHDALWRKAVLKRDKGLCQRCFSLGTLTPAVDAHHAIHKSQGLYVRYLMDNGIALCRQCHLRDERGKLKEWCVEHIGEDKFYEIMRTNQRIIASNSFDLERAVRKLREYVARSS